MALKKTMAGYWQKVNKTVENEDGSVSYIDGHEWIDQVDLNMHPLEEVATRKHWAIHDAHIKVPDKTTLEQEHEWHLEHGAEYVKQKRAEWQKLYDDNKPHIDAAHDAYQAAHKAWCEHAEHCKANDLDPNTYEAEKHQHLVEHYKD